MIIFHTSSVWWLTKYCELNYLTIWLILAYCIKPHMTCEVEQDPYHGTVAGLDCGAVDKTIGHEGVMDLDHGAMTEIMVHGAVEDLVHGATMKD